MIEQLKPSPIKQCFWCGASFHKLNRHSVETWAKAKYCSIPCRIKARQRAIPIKNCEYCGRSFSKPASGVSWRKWETTRFCSKHCVTTARNEMGEFGCPPGTGFAKPCVGCGKPIQGTIKTLACDNPKCKAKGKELRYRKMGESLVQLASQRGYGELVLEPYLLKRGWVTQYLITVEGRSFRLDFAKPEAKLYVEADGYAHRIKHAHDTERNRLLVDAGWMGLRFWNSEIRDNLPGVLSAIWH